MRVLLDTHVALWSMLDSPDLSPTARELLMRADVEVWISAARNWEIAIKHALGAKRSSVMPVSSSDALGYFEESGATILSITAQHAAAVAALPMLHADPFDRMLAAQALSEPLRLVAHDRQLAAYSSSAILV